MDHSPYQSVSSSTIVSLALVVVFEMGSPALHAAEGELTGFGKAQFGMSLEQVVSVLGPGAKKEKNDSGETFISHDLEIGGIEFEASYHFKYDQLQRVSLFEEDPVRERYFSKDNCEQLAEHTQEQIEAKYGKSDSGLERKTYVAKGVPGSAWNSSFTFDNNAMIEVQYLFVTYGGIDVCVGQVIYYRDKNDADTEEKQPGQF
jgi:hypothetical protein